MQRNVEIKARVEDLEAVKQRILALKSNAAYDVRPDSTAMIQRDSFFNLPAGKSGKLKLRQMGLYNELIYYDREESTGPKLSSYVKCQVNEDMEKLLTNALGTWGVVKKERNLIMVGQTRVHFDRVDGLGDFVELEVLLDDSQTVEDGQLIAEDLMSHMGVEEKDLISVAYVNMLAQNKS
ncbi:PREDICTED: uncharacterized protein LOC107173537 [Diuraphis noxia]|uniref:uncharacterized protein LOC107173537 n=1 Tax=Diuraphis noxia TaxID=143948 RepID=UPI0007637389|nr:PREDICTED: uncharacterized protein LOC107173537 [Diuraphis noxia]